MAKQKIKEILKEGKKSTTEISARIKRNYYDTLSFLREMESDKEIKRIEDNNYVRWELLK